MRYWESLYPEIVAPASLAAGVNCTGAEMREASAVGPTTQSPSSTYPCLHPRASPRRNSILLCLPFASILIVLILALAGEFLRGSSAADDSLVDLSHDSREWAPLRLSPSFVGGESETRPFVACPGSSAEASCADSEATSFSLSTASALLTIWSPQPKYSYSSPPPLEVPP